MRLGHKDSNNVSPEEKLLNLIKGKKKSAMPASGDQDMPSLKTTYPQVKGIGFLSLRRLMPLFFAASVIYLLASFIYPWVGLNKIKLPAPSEQKIEEPKLMPKQDAKSLEFYSEGIQARKIFSAVSGGQTQVSTIAGDTDSIQDITLVGIISGERPQAIIENKKTQQTYYVSKGQFIGEFQVEDIQEGKIIINFQGKRYELYI